MAATLKIKSITCERCLRNKKLKMCVQNETRSGQCKPVTLCPNGNSQPINLPFQVEGNIYFYQNGESEPIYKSFESINPMQILNNKIITLYTDIQQAGNCDLKLSYAITPSQNIAVLALDFVILSATTLIRYLRDFLSTLFVLLFRRSQLEEPPIADTADTATQAEEPSPDPTIPTEQLPPPEDASPDGSPSDGSSPDGDS